jgi:hypothetical protein
MAHIAESQHWYKRDGTPAYTVKSRDGTDRPATLRDARKLGLVPSVTEIIKSCHKPGLERWKLDQMLHSALTLPRGSEEPEEAWISRVWTDSQETARKAAERGTAIHAAIQGSYEGKHPGFEYLQHTLAADNELTSWLQKPSGLEVAAESSFAHPLGFGGKVDLEGSPPPFIVDFKTKEFGHDAELRTWDEHAMQLSAYRVGRNMPTAKCAIVYVSVSYPGLARLIEIPEKDLQRGWAMFQGLLSYWKAKSSFDPSWSEEVVTERELTEAKA